jgi:hypothetical protein
VLMLVIVLGSGHSPMLSQTGVRGQLPGVRGQLRAQLRPVAGHWSNMSDALKPIRR